MRRKPSFLVGLIGVLMLLNGNSARAQEPFRPLVPEGHWASHAVEDLMQRGVLEGYPDGFYRGKRPLTRYEFAVAMKRFIDKLVPANQPRRQSVVDELNREIALALEEADKHVDIPDVSLPKQEKAAPVMQKRAKKR